MSGSASDPTTDAEALLACLLAASGDVAPWHAYVELLRAQRDPLGAWLALRLATGAAGDDGDEATRRSEAELRHAIEPDLPECFAEVTLAAQLVNILARSPRITLLMEEVVRRDDPVVAARLLGCTQYCQIEALAPIFSLLAAHFRRFLDDIAARTIQVQAERDPKTSVGYLPYRLSNGWQLQVYDRAFKWHYVSGFTSPSGDEIDLTLYRAPHPFDAVIDYEPPPDVLRDVYGF